MRPAHGSSTLWSLAQPLRIWAQRFSLLLLIAAAVFLLVMSRANPQMTSRARMVALDFAALPLEVLRLPADLTVAGVLAYRTWSDVRAENAQLRLERDRLLEWRGMAQRLERENAELRGQLNVAPDPAPRFVTARVIAGAGGAYAQSVLLGAGSNSGLRPGQPAINTDGLVGRVVETGARSAVVVLLTDLNSRVPVLVEPSGERAILVGDNTRTLRLNFLPPEANLAPGQRVVTSGHGGVFPPGLLVGTVAELAARGARIEPAADFARLDFIRILDFGPEGYVGQPAGEPNRTTRRQP